MPVIKCPYCEKTKSIDDKRKTKGKWLIHCRDCDKWFPLESARFTKKGSK
jgi:uncharacterized protein YbaR (Trm112 family)